MKLIFKLATPYGLSTCAVTQRIPCLYHKTFYNTMENKVIIVAISAMSCKIFDSPRAFFRVEPYVNVTQCRMQDLSSPKTFQRSYPRTATKSGPLRLIDREVQLTDRGLHSGHTRLSGKDVVVVLPTSEIASSSSGGGFSLNTSRPLVASSASSGSLRLLGQQNRNTVKDQT